MPKCEFAHVRLEAAEKGKGASLLTMHLKNPNTTKTMSGGATESNMYRWLSNMGGDGWQMVSVQTIPNGATRQDLLFWLQRQL